VNKPTKEEWKELTGVTNYQWLEPILKHAGHKTLEIGCGSGLLSERLRALGYNSWTNDINEIDKPNHLIFDVLSEWPDGEYDTVFSSGLLEHFEDDEIIKILKEAKRHANNVISMVPNNNSRGYWIWRNHQTSIGEWPYGDEKTFDTLKPLYKKAGFKNIKEEYCGNDFLDGMYLLVTIGE